MPSLSAYLAKNYLNASTPNDSFSHDNDHRPTKKRRKSKAERTAGSSSLVIADDDHLLLSSRARVSNPDDDDPDAPVFFDTKVRSAEFRKAKKNAWTNVGASTSVDGEAGDNAQDEKGRNDTAQEGEDDEADQLLRNTIANSERQRMDLMADEAPAVVETDDTTTTRMESGVRPGLQTAADTARMLAQEEAERGRERQATKKSKKKSKSTTAENEEDQEETIYRDATGRRIDLTLRRAEFRAQEAAKQAAEKKERENAMGAVQLRQREERKQELEEAKFLTLGRSADDDEYNDRLKDQVRWDDPMAAYMAEKRAEEDRDEGGGDGVVARRKRGTNKDEVDGGVVRKPRKKEYAGAAPPNRYGIKPGWRWDGVDRGNGFEKEWFQARGKKSRNERLEYEWQMDE